MKLKVKVDADSGATYIAAINEDGEHRQSTTLNAGQEVELNLPGTDEAGIEFGEVVTNDHEPEAAEKSPEEGGKVDLDAPSPQPIGIGRIVTYYSCEDEPARDRPAIVTTVPEGGGGVSLTVFCEDGAGSYPVVGIPQAVPGAPITPGTWRWPERV